MTISFMPVNFILSHISYSTDYCKPKIELEDHRSKLKIQCKPAATIVQGQLFEDGGFV